MSSEPSGPDEPAERDTADLLWECIERVQSGESVDAARIRREYPEQAEELLRQLRAFCDIGEADRVEEPMKTSLGDYTLHRPLGRGGMGVVYEAWEGSMDRRVALKVLPAGIAADEKALQRFVREARTAGALGHPNIVSVFGMGVTEQTPYYAMLTGQSPRRFRLL